MSAPPVIGSVIGDRYEVLGLVGQGGMGRVYRARDRKLDRVVAVKTLHEGLLTNPEVRRRLQREALAAARLRSPYVATIHDFVMEESIAYFVQDFFEGPSLATLLSHEGALAPRRAVRLLIDACNALDAVHQAGVVHRDVKPSNFVVHYGPAEHDQGVSVERLVLLDFGIAKLLDHVWDEDSTPPRGMFIGTPVYMAPEQMRDPDRVDARADLYALGVVAFEMLVGHPPFLGSISAVLRAALEQPPPSLRSQGADISEELDAVVTRCLAKEPADRFASAREVREALAGTPEGRAAALSDPLLPAGHALPTGYPDLLRIEDSGSDTLLPVIDGVPPDYPAPRIGISDTLIPAFHEDSPIASSPGTAEPGGLRRALTWPAAAVLAFIDWLRDRLEGRRLLPAQPSPEPVHAPDAAPAASPPNLDLLRSYARAAGFDVTYEQGLMLHLRAGPGRAWPAGRYVALSLDDGDQTASMHTLATAVFRRGVPQIYELQGTPAEPCYVLAIDQRSPGVGVYHEWHALARERHVHVLMARPQGLIAAMHAGDAAAHFRTLLAQIREDPFALEGPIDDDLEFFGSGASIHAMLDDIRTRNAGFGLFGLEKWGTTSLLRRLRAELLSEGGHLLSWLDLSSCDDLTEAGVSRAVMQDLRTMLAERDERPIKRLGLLPDAADGVLALAQAAAPLFPRPPVLFFDRADALIEPAHPLDARMRLLVALRRWVRPAGDQLRMIVVLGGVHDALLTARHVPAGDGATPNPLWRVLKPYYAPLFSAAETSEFMSRMATRAGFELAPPALALVHDLTGGHKYLCRLVGSEVRARLAGQKNRAQRADPQLVRDAAQAVVLAHHDYFDALLGRSPPETRRLLARLARGTLRHSELFHLDPLARANTPSVADRLEAVRFALRHQLVHEQGGVYRLAIEILGQWLQLTGELEGAAPAASATPAPPTPALDPLVTEPGPSGIPASDTDPFLAAPLSTMIGPWPSSGDANTLRRLLPQAFNVDELALLLADLQEKLEDVTSRTKSLAVQAHDVVEWFQRRGRLAELTATVKRHRPGLFEAAQAAPIQS